MSTAIPAEVDPLQLVVNFNNKALIPVCEPPYNYVSIDCVEFVPARQEPPSSQKSGWDEFYATM